MRFSGKKLGLLIAASPLQPNFHHGLKVANAALAQGVDVYLYCIDEAVAGLNDPELQRLRERGLKLYACAYAAERRNLPRMDCALYAGLSIVADLIAHTDRFLAFT